MAASHWALYGLTGRPATLVFQAASAGNEGQLVPGITGLGEAAAATSRPAGTDAAGPPAEAAGPAVQRKAATVDAAVTTTGHTRMRLEVTTTSTAGGGGNLSRPGTVADMVVPSGPGRPLSPAEMRRARQLEITRRRATGLLVAVAVIFGLSTAFQSDAHWLGWVQATAVASLVGGLADWFAVTALFRRPLGLPIPHTAIVVERKDRFAETLGAFVQESFLTPDAVSARLQASRALPRAASWLADEQHASLLAGRAAEGLVGLADLIRDTDVHDVLDGVVRRRIEEVALAPMAGRALHRVTRDGRHEPVLDAALHGLSRYVSTHGEDMHRRLGAQSPWWLPGPLSNRMVHRLLDRSETVLAQMSADRRHPLRLHLTDALVGLAGQLQSDPLMQRRGEEMKAEFLAQPTVRELAATLWTEVKDELRAQSVQPGSELRQRLAALIAHGGRRLATDPELAAAVEKAADAALKVGLTSFDEELVGLVTGTIARWDAGDTAHRLELLLGPDLQYIRINGTVVGALAGLALHAIAAA